MSVLPSPPPVETLALVLVAYLLGCTTPWYYAQERMRGAGRWLVAQVPYQPPPGQQASEALEAAVEQGEASPRSGDGAGEK